jgi:hypothetical protein
LHAKVCLSGQTTAIPVPQLVMSQSSVFVTPAFGHSTTHFAPSAHVVWQGPDAQANPHVLPAAQVHEPFAHVPWQLGLCPSQLT